MNAVYPAHVNRLRRLRREQATGRREATAVVTDPRAELWSHLVHLVSVLDERAQVMQHQYARAAPGVPGAAGPALPAERGLRGRGRPLGRGRRMTSPRATVVVVN